MNQMTAIDQRITQIETGFVEQITGTEKTMKGCKTEIWEIQHKQKEANKHLKKEISHATSAAEKVGNALDNLTDTLMVKLSNYASLLDLANLEAELQKYATLRMQNEMEDRVKPLIDLCERDNK